MTCVPDSLIGKLTKKEYKIIGLNSRPNAKNFMKKMKEYNKETPNVTWQNEQLTKKQMEENMERINCIKINKLGKGYLCSSFDPLFFLYCELFEVSIDCDFYGTDIEYRNKKKSKRLINFSCNSSHFS